MRRGGDGRRELYRAGFLSRGQGGGVGSLSLYRWANNLTDCGTWIGRGNRPPTTRRVGCGICNWAMIFIVVGVGSQSNRLWHRDLSREPRPYETGRFAGGIQFSRLIAFPYSAACVSSLRVWVGSFFLSRPTPCLRSTCSGVFPAVEAPSSSGQSPGWT